MLAQLIAHIKDGQEVRKNLIALKELLREEPERKALLRLLETEDDFLLPLLQAEDAKTRKNTAQILGLLGKQDYLEPLVAAYEAESQLFVKSAYVQACEHLDCRPSLAVFKSRMDALTKESTASENSKHFREELAALQRLVFAYEKPKKHTFTGYDTPVNVILITNRDHKAVTAGQVQTGEIRELTAGIQIKNARISELLKIRTYSELLLVLSGSKQLPPDGKQIAEALAASNLQDLVEQLHDGRVPFYFRIEIKSRMELSEKSRLAKKIAAHLEELTHKTLINSTSGYELEIRLIENKQGSFYPLLKLFTIPEKRFAYRKTQVAASIHPAKAALVMELARPYLKENARVLDPFCGVGTMLLERNYCVHADTLYGIDYYEPAAAGARSNGEAAHVPLHIVQRSFFDFSHAYTFDEIVTNMPSKSREQSSHDIDMLYGKFFDKAQEVLAEEAILVLYVHDRAFVKNHVRRHKNMQILEEFLINAKEGTFVFVIQKHA